MNKCDVWEKLGEVEQVFPQESAEKCFRFVSIVSTFYPEISGAIKRRMGMAKILVFAFYIMKKGLI